MNRTNTTARLCKFLKSYSNNDTGAVAIIFGLAAIAVVSLVGGAVDYGRWFNAKSQTQAALDSSVLAAGRVLQTTNSTAAAIDAASKHFNRMKSLNTTRGTANFKVMPNGSSVQAEFAGAVATPFMGVAGVKELEINIASEAKLEVGGNAKKSYEIVMMLDVTGSMWGQKLADLKLAAKDLIDIVIWEDQGEKTSRVGLVPFSESVNVGKIGTEVASNASFPGNVNGGGNNGGSDKAEFVSRWGQNKTYYLAADCVSERTNSERYTDAGPYGQNKVGRVYTYDGKCRPENVIVPLSSDKDMLKGVVDSFIATGSTAGHLGTAWAWYLLSPNWRNVFSPKSRPGEYNDPELEKIAILMTDGSYNTQYCMGVKDSVINCKAENGSSNTQAKALCTNMKAAGVTVYTVGFKLGSNQSAIDIMQHCATSDAHFFKSESGEQLRLAFREIALQISTLRISK